MLFELSHGNKSVTKAFNWSKGSTSAEAQDRAGSPSVYHWWWVLLIHQHQLLLLEPYCVLKRGKDTFESVLDYSRTVSLMLHLLHGFMCTGIKREGIWSLKGVSESWAP